MSIELTSRRGAVGTGWHAVALRDGAENLLGPARVGRGKADARAGRVQWLDVEAGVARGDVRDADGGLCHARLELPAFRDGDRQAFLRVAQRHPELPARLAAGSYPQEIEAELAVSDVSLLPRGPAELSHDCSCLDWPGPCRHVSALLYVLVEAVDERPLLLLTLRGLALEDLVPPAEPTRQDPTDEGAGAETERAAGQGTRADGTRATGADGEGTAEERAAGDGAHADGPGGEGPVGEGPAARPSFDPARTDPARLAEVVGEDVAAIVHRFFTGAL